jgi:hypothetical protein
MAALLVVVGACSDDGSGDEAAPASTTALARSSCFWSEPTTFATNNTQYPDTGAAYWFTSVRLAAGSTLRLAGEYPHGRYVSFNAYGPDPATGEPGLPLDALADVEIGPDDGSTNPFVPGADRTVTERSYTVTVVGEAPPTEGGRAANTLYARSPVADGEATEAQLIFRLYVPDDGTEPLGGVALPKPTVETADGATMTGEEACVVLQADTTLPEDLPSLSVDQYRELVALGDPATHPAQDPPRWTRFFNARQALLSSFWAGTSQEAEIAGLDATEQGGYYSNAHADYVVAPVNRLLGPDPRGANVLVVRGLAPRTPHTVDGESTMGDGDVRYWSLCQNESPVTTRGSGCLYDEQIPLDDEGRYTIVLGRPEDRPADATGGCGVAWLDWGPGDGVDRPEAGTLLLRQILPAPGFEGAIARVEAPGEEAATMGPYLPEMTYAAAATFSVPDCR